MVKALALESGVRGFANAVKRLAVKDKKFAEELVYMHGIRSEITPNALKGITKDMFEASGKMTERGRAEVQRVIEEMKLPKNATWDDILAAVKASKERVSANFQSKFVYSAKKLEATVAKLKAAKLKKHLMNGLK